MRQTVVFISILLSLSYAQEKIPLRELWAISDTANFDLQSIDQKIRIQELDKSSRKGKLGPVIGISSGYQYQTDPFQITFPGGVSIKILQEHNYFNSVWLNWTLFEGLKRFYEIDGAEYQLQEIREQRNFARETIQHQLARLALQSSLISIQGKLLDQSDRRIRINLDKAKSLWRKGQISSADTLEFWQSILDIERGKQSISESEQLLYSEIGFLVGRQKPVQPIIEDVPELDPKLFAELDIRSDEQALQYEHTKIETQYSSVGGTYWPKISAGASWQYDKPGYDPIANDWVSYGKFGIGLNWVLWDWNQRKNGREQLEVLNNENSIRQYRLKTQREKELLKLKISLRKLEVEKEITRQQLNLKRKYYEYRQKQYQLQQIDATQLSLTETELTILELKIENLIKEIEVSKIDQIFVCGNTSKWINGMEKNNDDQ